MRGNLPQIREVVLEEFRNTCQILAEVILDLAHQCPLHEKIDAAGNHDDGQNQGGAVQEGKAGLFSSLSA